MIHDLGIPISEVEETLAFKHQVVLQSTNRFRWRSLESLPESELDNMNFASSLCRSVRGFESKRITAVKKRNRVVQTLRVGILILLVATFCTRPVFSGPSDFVLLAQEEQKPDNVSNVSVSRSYVWPAIVVFILFGGAVFVVCKSSNRT